ncbi:MAG: glycosyl transferase family 2 [Phenylobacterium sp. RIFCSPHIGHO2_01_FULL_69_31]|uniref:glycosyltransferase family 2 protein n=1 Tax=Phenylobacterium sp. RIFCSPHIGHO2_01_FULL_69_31 TaxID=1801944 RepID=UPI0008B02551|nr:glycosyltransferase [Phenylobacterium sp. RIFCSPHIGHO2_01_FULL_69_31]OHB27890.1 MAG: glycosyl transferase family 2 [Phenylobacterium sp. RIFCSPHIGHO2_01_FULL_69_31]
MRQSVSVIVPHYNDPAGLDACLAALTSQSVAPDEIVVADNDSPQGEAEIARVIDGRARLVIVTEKGAGPARNGAVAACTGEVLAFTDSDCLPAPEWLERGLAALDDADFVGGGMRVLVADEEDLTAAEAFERVFAFDNRMYVLRKRFTVTANLLCPRRVFDAVGGFRTGVSEDLDWCLRARDLGYRIRYAPDAVVGHPARRTWPELVRKWRRLNEETFGLTSAKPGGRLKWLILALAMPLSAVAHLPKVLLSPALSKPGDRLKASVMLFRARIWRGLDYIRILMNAR